MSEEEIFHEALARNLPEERAAYLEQTCAGNSALRASVEALLRANVGASGFLSEPPSAVTGSTEAGSPSGTDDGMSLDFLMPSEKPGALGRLGHYDVLEVIGQGGMGIVLRAFDGKLHRVVAIKVMAAQLATNAMARKRFTREAQAAAAVSHDHIVTIHAVEEAHGLPYLVMQYVSGLSLQQRLDRDGPLQVTEIVRIGMQTASGLAAAHAQGLTHRDIKPANILLENGVERVKITDFGLARAATDASLTQSGVVAGTPQYMSPEQAQGTRVDQRSDLFSLGSVLYAMCTGRAPFRASETMAVLKRVCEEPPAPIRDSNSEIPDWLVAIIDKLHAKNPAERFQSAAEVAALLGRHLAHLQHPSVAPLPAGVAGAESSKPRSAAESGASKTQPRPHNRRWAVAAAVVLAFVAGLSLTEATGVTKLVPTVIRIFTPDGTLVVDVNDPGVKVTIEGDGGLVITGAGLEEIRLRPGSYKVHADRDGKKVPLERELVRISKGGREVVRVKLEAPPAPVNAKADHGAFVLLNGKGADIGKYATLAEAVQTASDGDTIEIRGNGPFVSRPIKVSRPLNIRAGADFRPVIKLSAEASQAKAMIEADAPLVLEGLEFQRLDLNEKPHTDWHHVIVASQALYAANCRFLTRKVDVHIAATGTHPTELRNCEFLSPATVTNAAGINTPRAIHSWPGRGLVLDNCLLTASVFTARGLGDPKGGVFRLTHNTCRNSRVLNLTFSADDGDATEFAKADWTVKALEVQASDNVFDADAAFVFGQRVKAVVTPGEAEALLARMVGWRGERNVYTGDGAFLSLNRVSPTVALAPPKLPAGLAGWRQFWGTTEEGSVEGRVRFQGGNLVAKAESALEEMTPDDFRLRPDSAGYRAGKNGKDLGADVDLVGPGPAYERWKKTPEYQQWLKETGQLKAITEPKADSGAFVVLASKGAPERKCATLAEAVKAAFSGDTIEIRGDGPFVTPPLRLSKKALVLRAGPGSRPVFMPSPEALLAGYLLRTSAPLVLEGLEFHYAVAGEVASGVHSPISMDNSSALFVAHCRIIGRGSTRGIGCLSQHCELRHCEFLLGQAETNAVSWKPLPAGRLIMDNCTIAGNALSLPLGYKGDPLPGGSIALTRNSVVRGSAIVLGRWRLDEGGDRPLSLTVTDNVVAGRGFLFLVDWKPVPEQTPAAVEAFFKKLLSYQDQRNLVDAGTQLLVHQTEGGKRVTLDRSVKDLKTWQAFWALERLDSIMGPVRFQGGKLADRVVQDPFGLTPADFRLVDGSPGKGAGSGGKDLGADVDLVGPGPAYERWKNTPEYQQWLKDTKQTQSESGERQSAEVFLRHGGKLQLWTPGGSAPFRLEKPGQPWPTGTWNVASVAVDNSTTITNGDLAALRDFPRLNEVNLAYCRVTTATLLDHIEDKPLRELYLNGVPTTRADAVRLGKIKTLVTLYVTGANWDDDDIAQLAGLPLRAVNVGRTKMTDRSLELLGRLPNLTNLYVTGTKISDAGLTALYPCKTLRILDVSRTRITAAGIEKLRQALPQCEVTALDLAK